MNRCEIAWDLGSERRMQSPTSESGEFKPASKPLGLVTGGGAGSYDGSWNYEKEKMKVQNSKKLRDLKMLPG
jgi:hypothetical protein